jgi:predicted MFS family arabinose efflux permease
MGVVALAAETLGSATAGALVVALLAAFSVASGVQSVTFKDVLAKTVPKGRRGRLLATRSFLGAGLTLGAGLAIRLLLSEDTDASAFAWPLFIGAALWVVGVAIFALIGERPGHTDGGRSAITEVKKGMALLRREAGFRRFLATRGLLLAIPLATPFYVVLFHERLGGGLGSLGVFIIATGVTGLVASPIWGWFADKSSRRVMLAAGLIGALAAALAVATTLLPEAWRTAPVLSIVLVVNAFAYGGARLGRKTYLVDAAPSEERPLFVSSANTTIGALTIVGASLGAIGQAIGVEALVIVLGALCLLASVSAWLTPEADDMVSRSEA